MNMASVGRVVVPVFHRIPKHICPVLKRTPVACYSATSKKTEQSGYVIGKRTEVDPKRVQEIIDEGERSYDEQNDVNSPYYHSGGFDQDNFVDLWTRRIVMFLGISVCNVMGLLYLWYKPRITRRERAERINRVIAERRAAGLPLIDPDYVPRDRIILPDDDESSH